MPTFRTRPWQGLAGSIATMLKSSPELSAMDKIGIEKSAADMNYRQTLTQKVHEEMQRERAADVLRRDPEKQLEYAAYASGVSFPDAQQVRRRMHGETVDPPTPNDDEGNPMPRPLLPRPNISEPQERNLMAQMAATYANNLGTGRTNAHQLTQAGEVLAGQRIRDLISEEPNPAIQNQYKAALPGSGYREPYSGSANSAGAFVNQETGKPGIVDQQLFDNYRRSIAKLGDQRESAAGYSDARAGAVPALIDQRAASAERLRREPTARPAPQRTEAQEARDRGYAEQATERAALLRGQREEQQEKKGRSLFIQAQQSDPTMRGLRPGGWVSGKGLELRDKSGRVVGYFGELAR